jgi:DNA polymerase beta
MHEENESPARNAYKVKAFTSAIKVLKQLDHPLRSMEEAKKVSDLSFLPFLSS